MDLDVIHNICKTEVKVQFEDFKRRIYTPVFEIEDDVIKVEIEDMKAAIYQKVFGKLYNIYDISFEQHKVIEGILNEYRNKAVTIGTRFAEKMKAHSSKS